MSDSRTAGKVDESFTPRIVPADDEPDLPPGFRPLRLAVQPAGTIVHVTRPEVTVGRHRSCDVHLPLPDVSRRHGRLLFQGGKWWVLDIGSLNGIFVNDALIDSRALIPGDRVRIGGFTLIVQPTAAEIDDEQEHAVLRSIAVALAPEPAEQRRAS